MSSDSGVPNNKTDHWVGTTLSFQKSPISARSFINDITMFGAKEENSRGLLVFRYHLKSSTLDLKDDDCALPSMSRGCHL
ncbi:hypothetical protein TNCV_586961 [Trichonephila clavipes]|nr:hypothetical protein TNCV_586961 [Trichonephila clavipes]